MTIGEWVSLLSAITVFVFGNAGIVSFFALMNERRKFSEEMALKWAEFNSSKAATNAVALKGAAESVQISAEVLAEQKEWIEKRFADYEKRLSESEQRENKLISENKELGARIERLEKAQREYRNLVKSIAGELLVELGRNGHVDLVKLKEIVSRLLGDR